MRTNTLRKLINTQLKQVDTTIPVYYQIAKDSAMYPHIVFYLSSINTGDLVRDDYSLSVEIWTKGTAYEILDLADKVEDLLKTKNLPQTAILPTFYVERRTTVIDDDKDIQHQLIEFTIQNYER